MFLNISLVLQNYCKIQMLSSCLLFSVPRETLIFEGLVKASSLHMDNSIYHSEIDVLFKVGIQYLR